MHVSLTVGSDMPEELRHVHLFVFPSAATAASYDDFELHKRSATEPKKHTPTDTAISPVPSQEISRNNTQAVALMLLTHTGDVRWINDEIYEKINMTKLRKPTSMDHLQGRRVKANGKRDWDKLEHIERIISRKQNMRSVACQLEN